MHSNKEVPPSNKSPANNANGIKTQSGYKVVYHPTVYSKLTQSLRSIMSNPNRGGHSRRGLTQEQKSGAWLKEYLRTYQLLRASITHRQQNPGPPPSDDDFVPCTYNTTKSKAPASSSGKKSKASASSSGKKSKAPASSMVDPDSDDDFVPCTYTGRSLRHPPLRRWLIQTRTMILFLVLTLGRSNFN